MSIIQHLNAISHRRLIPYRKLCRNAYPNESTLIVEKKAVCLYTALQHRASIFFSLIQEIEIRVRNEMTRIMKENAHNNDLLYHFCYLAIDNDRTNLSEYSQKDLKNRLIKLINDTCPPNRTQVEFLNNINYAYQRLKQQNVSADDIIANMTFGFWVNLINRRNQHYLHWNNMFYRRIFNNRFNTIQQLFNDLREVNDFRNRFSHQDCIWNKSVRTPYEALKNLKNTYSRFSNLLDKLDPYRHSFRTISTYLSWQESLNFDYDVFVAEMEQMMKTSFI